MRPLLRSLALPRLLGLSLLAFNASADAADAGFRGPLGASADPYMTFYKDNYYLAATDAHDGQIFMRKAPTIGGLLGAAPQVVFHTTDANADQQIWAPSFMVIDDHWYLYYTASNGTDSTHRMYVLESTATVSSGARPDGPYVLKGRIYDASNDVWAIDGLPMKINGAWYFVWSGVVDNTSNQLLLAPMSNPWTLSGPATHLPAAGGCPEVREAPAVLHHKKRTFLVYSTCDTGKPDYQLWMMSIGRGQDPRVASSWTQTPGAVFSRNDDSGVYGPGSNNFFKSPDGKQDWIAYHAKGASGYTYDGRTTRAQRLTWKADGTPDFGTPLAVGATQALPGGDPGGSPVAINDTDVGPLATGPVAAPGGKCVEVSQGDPTNGTPVQLGDCSGAPAQQWTVAGDGTLRALGKCLDIVGNGTANSAVLELWDCNGVGGQQWIPQADGALLNPQSGRCLDDPQFNTASGTRLAIWDCNHLAPQVYRLPAATWRVAYAGSWNAGPGCGAQCFRGDDHWSNQVGATATYSFHGSRVVLLSVKDSGNGIAAVSVDGGPQALVDMYAPVRAGEQVQWVSPPLFDGDHTLRVRVTGMRNAASGDAFVSADRVEVTP